MVDMFALQFGIPGGPELLLILLVAVLLFGANKIPKLARSTGEAMGEFRKGREEVEQELQEMQDGPENAEAGAAAAADEEPEFGTETADEEPDVEAETADDVAIDDAEEETN